MGQSFYIIFFKPGPQWIEGKTVFEQPLDEHVNYINALFKQGRVLMAGPLGDGAGGMTIMQVTNEEEAKELAATDPNIKNGVVRAELKQWRPIAWDRTDETKVYYEEASLKTIRVERK